MKEFIKKYLPEVKKEIGLTFLEQRV